MRSDELNEIYVRALARRMLPLATRYNADIDPQTLHTYAIIAAQTFEYIVSVARAVGASGAMHDDVRIDVTVDIK